MEGFVPCGLLMRNIWADQQLFYILKEELES